MTVTLTIDGKEYPVNGPVEIKPAWEVRLSEFRAALDPIAEQWRVRYKLSLDRLDNIEIEVFADNHLVIEPCIREMKVAAKKFLDENYLKRIVRD